MNDDNIDQATVGIAEAVRAACLTVALESYEDVRIRGLCQERAWECAIGAIRALNLW